MLDGRAAVLEYIDRYMAGATTYDWRWATLRSAQAGDWRIVQFHGSSPRATTPRG